MIPYFPKQISNKGIYLYLGALLTVCIFFISYAMEYVYILLGIIWIIVFFVLSTSTTKAWLNISQRKFNLLLFWIAVGVRLAWVTYSFFFYIQKTGIPFEFEAGDSQMYFVEASWLCLESPKDIVGYLFVNSNGVSDSGYLFYLAFLYKVIGPNIYLTRVVKCLISAFTCVLLYKVTSRTMGEQVGRMAGVFACFMPNLIIYCGLHLKETEMLFLSVAFLERSDYLIRSKRYNIWTIALPLLLAFSLFTFRTVLGAAAVLSFATAIVFTQSRIIGRGKRIMLVAWGILAVVTLAGGTIATEIEGYWGMRDTNEDAKRNYQVSKGVSWAQYATGTVMAPMIFVLPFPTMVDVDEQYNQQIMHGGNYVRNFMGVFVIIALFDAIFKKKNWRDFSLLGSFVIAYLGVISASGYANAERFLLPGLPVLIIFWAYGLSILNVKYFRWLKVWYWVTPIMSFAWAFFKIGSRGLF